MDITQAEFENNRQILNDALRMYEANLRHGAKPTEKEMEACFEMAKKLLTTKNS